MIETNAEICVDEKGRWTFRGEPLINESVLGHFKRNLRCNDRGFYIVNEFGSKLEHAYIQSVRGFPLIVQSFELTGPPLGCSFSLETGEHLTAGVEEVLVVNESTVAVQLPGRGFAARLSGAAMTQLAEYLDIRGDDYFLDYGADRVALGRAQLSELFG